jgi:WD40 repeat protein
MRVVCGVPVSWDPHNAATRRYPNTELAVWSPCNKFIAISRCNATKVHTLDSATLQQLQSLEFPPKTPASPQALIFSPDGRILTCSGGTARGAFVTSWDLQTGGVVSAITRRGPGGQKKSRITYSTNGKTVGVLHHFDFASFISIYDVVSGVHTHDIYHGARKDRHSVADPPPYDIWTHRESLRFATAKQTTITVWEVEFIAGATSTKVETLSVPGRFVKDHSPRIGDVPNFMANAHFLPALCRLAFVHFDRSRAILVWGVRGSKSLLQHTNIGPSPGMAFSSDGHFFACSSGGPEIYLWKESSTGYVLHEKLIFDNDQGSSTARPLFSPNGESIIVFGRSTIQSWNITPSSTLTQAPQRKEHFVLDFLPDSPLAVVARQRDKAMVVLDLDSGIPRLTIDASTEVHGLRVIGNTVTVIGDGKAITWDLAGGDDARMGVEDSVQTINFVVQEPGNVVAASISLDFRHIALLRQQGTGLPDRDLCVYSAFKPHSAPFVEWDTLWFPPSGQSIWCAAGNKSQLYRTISLKPTISATGVEDLPPGCPWRPPRGYRVTNNGWILSGGGERLLMLPPSWQSETTQRVWNGKFLGLVHGVLPEPVILELEP